MIAIEKLTFIYNQMKWNDKMNESGHVRRVVSIARESPLLWVVKTSSTYIHSHWPTSITLSLCVLRNRRWGEHWQYHWPSWSLEKEAVTGCVVLCYMCAWWITPQVLFYFLLNNDTLETLSKYTIFFLCLKF